MGEEYCVRQSGLQNYIQRWGVENIRTFALQGRMLGPETVCFLLFGGFLMYSVSISFRELKNAKKIPLFFRGCGVQNYIVIEKKLRKNIGQALGPGEIIWVGVNYIQGWGWGHT